MCISGIDSKTSKQGPPLLIMFSANMNALMSFAQIPNFLGVQHHSGRYSHFPILNII